MEPLRHPRGPLCRPSLLGIDLGSFSQMRMLRAFRVFRLFKRIKSLNKIIVSLTNAVHKHLANAAIVQILVMCIATPSSPLICFATSERMARTST